MQKSFDYIVVGAGSSGSIVAARLAEETQASVLLVEAGPGANENPDTLSADGFKYCFANDNVMLDRASAKQAYMNNRSIYQGTGSTMGGSGSVNGMVYTRGDKADFESWPKGWQWDDISPTFCAIEARLQPQQRAATHFTQQAIAAGAAVDLTHKDGLNDGNLAGFIGHNDMNFQGEQRQSSYATFLHGKNHANLTCLTHCLTHKIIIENAKAVGVEIEHQQQRFTISAKQEVILCAGALETPKLLMLSGIGPASELRKHGIDVQLAQNAIGKNLHDHPNICIFYRGKQPIDFGYPQLYAFKRMNKQLPLTSATQPDTCFAFFAAPITLHQSMLRIVPTLLLPKTLYANKKLRNIIRAMINGAFKLPLLNRFINNIYGIVVILGKPLSRGCVTLQSNNARDQALVNCNYYANPADLDTMVQGVLDAQNMAAHSALQQWGNKALSAAAKTQKTAKIKNAIKNATMTTFHFCGSCRMGDDDDAPVNPQLQLKGIQSLRIADASVMPEVPVSALNAPSMMIGHRAVDFILQAQTEHL